MQKELGISHGANNVSVQHKNSIVREGSSIPTRIRQATIPMHTEGGFPQSTGSHDSQYIYIKRTN